MQVAGRLDGGQDEAPDVIVDGCRITWADFGRMIASFDGWRFRMTFGGDDVPAKTPPPDASHPM